MPDLVFLYSADDTSVALEALRLGNLLVVKRDYGLGEGLFVVSEPLDAVSHSFCHFYVLPDERFISEISMGKGIKAKTGKNFCYIKDRNGSAAIILSQNTKPSKGEVCVGSLEFAARTYPSDSEPLQPRPPVFSQAFRRLRSFIRRSAQPVSNKLYPKTVYVFPQAMELLREDFSRSPWPTIEIPD